MEHLKTIISIDQAKLVALSLIPDIKAYCTAHPDEFAAFLEHEKYSQKADYIDIKNLNRRLNYGKYR